MSLGSFFTSTHFCLIISSSTRISCISSICFTHICFNATSQCTAVLNLPSAIYGLTPFRWLRFITLTPIYPTFYYGNITFIYALLINAQFFKNSIRATTGVWCIESDEEDS